MNHRPSRRELMQAVGGMVLALAPLAGCMSSGSPRQPPPKPARIGVLTPGSPGPSVYRDAFLDGLREHGYLEGQNIVIEYRYAEGRLERFAGLAGELVALPVDAILVLGGTPEVGAVKDVTTTIPIVFVAAGDPVQSGLVASLARPGGNVTGLSTMAAGLAGKRLERLQEAVPEIAHVAVLWNVANAAKARELSEAQAAAHVLGIRLQSLAVREPNDLESAFQAASMEGAEGLFVLNDPLMFTSRLRIVNLATESRLPAMYENREFVLDGGLMAYGPSFTAALRRAANYVDRVLNGVGPADLPVEQPTAFEFVVNMKAARELGITLPNKVLLQVTEAIQ